MRAYLCRFDDIPDGAARGFDSTGMPREAMFVVRRGDRVRGWLDACPHVDGARLAWRKDAYLSADRNSIVCYGHGAVFDMDTGVCTKGPCVGQALTPVTLECDEGALWITSPHVAK